MEIINQNKELNSISIKIDISCYIYTEKKPKLNFLFNIFLIK